MHSASFRLRRRFFAALKATIACACVVSIVGGEPVFGQSSDRGDRGDRGRGDWGGRGGDDSGRSRFSMFGGGMMGSPPPGGSMMGGPPMGGFDPSAMLSRFDRNGNKMLDPDETQGPAGFFLQRMAQSNPKIDLSKPIPLDVVAGEFERMRQERMGGSSFSGGSSWGGSPWGGSSWGGSPWGSTPQTEQETSGPKPLVPTFGIPTPPAAVRSFGTSSGAEPPVAVTERDLREAEDRMGRYDRNRDGFLSSEELSGGRWSDDPMQYDRNGDGKLSKEELAVRYAKRRIAEEQQQQGQSSPGSSDPRSSGRSMMFMSGGMGGGMMSFGGEGGGDRGSDRGGERGSDGERGSKEKERPKSLRQLSTREKIEKESGKPDWFTRDDKDADGQVSMSEFASTWDEGIVADFAKFDLNADGFITTIEVRKAIANGATRSGSSSRSSSSMASSSRRDSSNSDATKTGSTVSSGAEPAASTTLANSESPKPAGDTKPAETKPTTSSATASVNTDDPKFQKTVDWARKQIGKYDKNSDGALTPNEWQEMPVPPKNEWDYDGDGRITAEEYARARMG